MSANRASGWEREIGYETEITGKGRSEGKEEEEEIGTWYTWESRRRALSRVFPLVFQELASEAWKGSGGRGGQGGVLITSRFWVTQGKRGEWRPASRRRRRRRRAAHGGMHDRRRHGGGREERGRPGAR